MNPADFRITTFATGLNFPVGMTALSDGSILVATTNGDSFFGSDSGTLTRLADTDGDGIAEVVQPLVTNVAGGRLTSVRRAGELIAVTGQGQDNPISLYRTGDDPGDPLTFLGRIELDYPSGAWLHPHSALALREAPGEPGRFELYFQLGSDRNFATTTRRVELVGLGLSASLAGDAIHRVTLAYDGSALAAVDHTQIATGLRNASGLLFDPSTGDLYIAENGIDGLVNANEPHSADEINVIAANEIGTTVVDFGFPETYEAYRTGDTIGSTGRLPAAIFQPLPPPDGEEAEGINEAAFAPPAFPEALRGKLFAGFHGKYGLGGLPNEENPVALVDLSTGESFHIIANDEEEVGHLDGLLSTFDTLYLADISPLGGFDRSNAHTGVIYAVTSLIDRVEGDYNLDGMVDAADYTVWRDQLGSPYVESDYARWKSHFGSAGEVTRQSTAIPEPATAALLLAPALLLGLQRSRRYVPRHRR